MLILKVVWNNSINGLQCYIFKILIRPCYGWDIADLTLGTGFHGKLFFCTFTQVPTFYWLFGKIWPSWIRNKSYFWKKVFFGEVMTERKNRILRIQYMATWCDGTFDVNMTSSEVVRTRHHIRRFLRRSLVLKIKLNTGQTFGNSDENKTEHRPDAWQLGQDWKKKKYG